MIKLTERGKQIRRDTLTLGLPHYIYHYGGSFSVVEILTALYDHIMGPDDRCIMSKGHCWIPQVVLLRERGLSPGFGPRLDDGKECLVGHPFLDPPNGIYATTGSLGHGMPIGLGMALAKKMQKEDGRIFVIIGDGEAQEGTFWESILLGRKFALTNLYVIVDRNKIQGSGRVDEIIPMPNLASIAGAAYWLTYRVNGHDVPAICDAIASLEKNPAPFPRLVIAETVKGAGVSFMEDDPSWHARYPTAEEKDRMFAELQPETQAGVI